MTSATMIKILTGFALAVPVPCAAADEITVGQPRPLMALAGELAARYGYLVTYEDGPTDNADVLKEQRRNGLEYRYPKWKPVVFHVDAHEAATTDIATEEPL